MSDIQMTSHDQIAATVRAFYESHPYPGRIPKLSGPPLPEELRADHHLLWPHRPFCDNPRILVAGCGTVQAVRHALRWPRAQFLGVDASQASIAECRALADRRGVLNLTLRQLPIERVGELGQEFDQIICTGVLHHLPDPDAGLAALRAVLAPQGAMHLMLYAPHGRAGIYLLQDYCRRLGLGIGSAEISDLFKTLQALPSGHPIWPLMQSSPDFQHEAGLADALLHLRDRPYSVPEFLDFVARGGLRLGRWIRQAPYLRGRPGHAAFRPPRRPGAAGPICGHGAVPGHDAAPQRRASPAGRTRRRNHPHGRKLAGLPPVAAARHHLRRKAHRAGQGGRVAEPPPQRDRHLPARHGRAAASLVRHGRTAQHGRVGPGIAAGAGARLPRNPLAARPDRARRLERRTGRDQG
ncbi:class I SAM-dependent methyltransferase (plasmid) [Paracoccus yeei]